VSEWVSVAVFEVTGKLAIGLLLSMLASECGDVLLVWVGCIITHHPATCCILSWSPLLLHCQMALVSSFGSRLSVFVLWVPWTVPPCAVLIS
jgi:hypothetical protein